MIMNKHKRSVLIAVLGISMLIFNFTRLKGSECIRAIHVVTLITMGALMGVLLMNIIAMIKERRA